MNFELDNKALRLTPDEIAGLTSTLRGGDITEDALAALAARGLVIRNDESWSLDPVVAALFEPFVQPAWALRVAVVGSDRARVVTYCITDDVTTRVVDDESDRTLSAIPTAELLVSIRADLPVPPNDPSVERGPEVSSTELGEVAALAVAGSRARAVERLVSLGIEPTTSDRYAGALSAPEQVLTAWNGSTGLAWAIDADRRVWNAPLTEAADGDLVALGEASTVDVLLGIAGLLPGGPGWAHVAVPIAERPAP